jgi:hypothetical protein
MHDEGQHPMQLVWWVGMMQLMLSLDLSRQ